MPERPGRSHISPLVAIPFTWLWQWPHNIFVRDIHSLRDGRGTCVTEENPADRTRAGILRGPAIEESRVPPGQSWGPERGLG